MDDKEKQQQAAINVYGLANIGCTMENVTFQTLVQGAEAQTAEVVKPAEEKEVKTEETVIDSRLASDEAMRYWKRLQEQGFVDDRYQLLKETTRKQAMYIADLFAEKLAMKSKWKPFQTLWGISNLAQEKWDMQQTGTMPSRYNDIDKIFMD